MSSGLLAMLLAGAGSSGGGITPPPPGSSDLRPVLDDPVAMSLRPELPPIATLRVGPGREFATISGARYRAIVLRNASITAAGHPVPTGTSGEEMGALRAHRVDVLVDPGTYTEAAGWSFGIAPHIAFYAADGGHGSVVCNFGVEAGLGWFHMEGFTLRPALDGSGAKYAVHHAGIGTSTYARMALDTADRYAGMGGTTVTGMDGYANGFTTFYDCQFDGSGTNMHGDNGVSSNQTLCYIGCTATGNLEFSAGPADTMWAIDNVAVGPIYTVGNYYGADNTTGPRPGGFTSATKTSPDTTRRDWPVPVGGISPWWRTQLGL